MTSTTNPSAMLADSLAQFSKAAYSAFTEIENQSRIEVLRAASETREAREETREARSERDKVAREAQGWKQEAADAKATLAQAELTIAHQAENIESQHETIAQLRREVSQWKDQSRNWQEHFLRVEQERCAQSSRIDELVKQQYTRSLNTALFTPKQKYASVTHPHTINSAPSSITTNGATIPSPTQPPFYKSAALLRTSDTGSCSDTSSSLPAKSKQANQGVITKRQRDVPPNSSEEALQTSVVVQYQNPSSSKRKIKGNNPNVAAASSSQWQDPQTLAGSRTTLIRRVQAVVHVKRESDDDSPEDLSATANIANDEAPDEDEVVGVNQRRPSRRSRKIIKDDEEDIEQNYLAADGNPVWDSGHSRHRSAIVNYREEDEDEDDEDELMMGAEENHEEVYGTQRVETLDAQRSKQQPYPKSVVAPPPPKKKRKLATR